MTTNEQSHKVTEIFSDLNVSLADLPSDCACISSNVHRNFQDLKKVYDDHIETQNKKLDEMKEENKKLQEINLDALGTCALLIPKLRESLNYTLNKFWKRYKDKLEKYRDKYVQYINDKKIPSQVLLYAEGLPFAIYITQIDIKNSLGLNNIEEIQVLCRYYLFINKIFHPNFNEPPKMETVINTLRDNVDCDICKRFNISLEFLNIFEKYV